MIREFVLQLKRGSLRPAYFTDKYGVDPLDRFHEQLDGLAAGDLLATRSAERLSLTRAALLRVDVLLQRLLPAAAHRHPVHVVVGAGESGSGLWALSLAR